MPTGFIPPQDPLTNGGSPSDPKTGVAAVGDPLVIAGRAFSSRLLLGTGKFPSSAVMGAAARAAGADIVTVALRRVDLDAGEDDDILGALDDDVLILTNTSGAVDADEA